MRRFRSQWCPVGRIRASSATMTVLEAGDVCRVLIRTTDHAKETIGGGATAYDHALLVASNHAELPVLSNGYAADDGFELLEGRESLAHMQSRVHLRHFGWTEAFNEGRTTMYRRRSRVR